MRTILRQALIPLLGFLALVVLAFGVAWAEYPEKPITLVIPFGAGGSHDLHARGVSGIFPDVLGQPVLVKLMPGGAATIGTNFVVQARPDGYTILFSHNAIDLILPQTRKVPYDSVRDLVPLFQLNASSPVLAVHAGRPWKTVQEFIDYAKANPGKVNVATAGVWSAGHTATEIFLKETGIKVTQIPFHGGGPSLRALLAGDADASFQFSTQLRPQMKAGKVRVLVVAGAKRIKGPLFKDIPTMKELGMGEGFVMGRIFYASRKVPAERRKKLRDSFVKLLKLKSFTRFMRSIGEPIDYMDGPEIDKLRPKLWKEYGELIRGMARKKKMK